MVGAPIQVEDVPAERAGAVVACVAPLFSLRPDIHHWLYYYTQLGVSKFHMYTPSLHAHEATHYNEPHEVRMSAGARIADAGTDCIRLDLRCKACTHWQHKS